MLVLLLHYYIPPPPPPLLLLLSYDYSWCSRRVLEVLSSRVVVVVAVQRASRVTQSTLLPHYYTTTSGGARPAVHSLGSRWSWLVSRWPVRSRGARGARDANCPEQSAQSPCSSQALTISLIVTSLALTLSRALTLILTLPEFEP